MNEKIMKQEATYDYLKDEVHCLYAEKKELQERINKAIEYIERTCVTNTKWVSYPKGEFFNIDELLDILKGSDKDE